MRKPVAAICVCAGMISQIHAASLGLNFVGSDSTRGTLSPSAVAGLPAFQQPAWNNINGASTFNTTFTDTAGQSFTVSRIAGDASTGSLALNTTDGLHDDNDQLMNGFLSGSVGSSDKLDFLSLPASYVTAGYSVIVYADGTSGSVENISLDANRIGNFTSLRFYLQDTTTFDGTFVRAISTISAAPTVGANYVQFDNLTASSFTLLMLPRSGSDRRYFNAVQVVQNVPEPSSVTLFCAGLGSSLFLLRRFWPKRAIH